LGMINLAKYEDFVYPKESRQNSSLDKDFADGLND
jgi:hypothetical protein